MSDAKSSPLESAMWWIIVLAGVGVPPTAIPTSTRLSPPLPVAAAASRNDPREQTGIARVAQTANFRVRSHLDTPRAGQVAELCETLFARLRRQWVGEDEPPPWQPRCEVVLHPDRTSYLQAVRQGGGQTVGSSLIQIGGGRVLLRRIDLFAEDRGRALAALSHELVHVLFADLFPNTVPPRWAEEGLALLHDTDDKQSRHAADLRYALRSQTTLPLESLFTTASYPAGWQRAVFYAQSMSVVEYLVQLDEAQEFKRFIALCQKVGHERALRAVYDIDGLHELDRRWKQHAVALEGRVPDSG